MTPRNLKGFLVVGEKKVLDEFTDMKKKIKALRGTVDEVLDAVEKAIKILQD